MDGEDEPGSWKLPELLIRFIRAAHELNRCGPIHEAGLSAQQIRALLYLIRHEGSTIKELGYALSLSEARSSRLADELVGMGQVLHERDSVDRRHVRLRVTEAASKRAMGIYQERTTALKSALDGFTDSDIDIFTRVLGRVVEEFEALAYRNSDPHVAHV